MKNLIEQKIVFGSNEFLNSTGFITKINTVKEGKEIIMSLDLNDSIDPGHFIIITTKQLDTLIKFNKLEWLAENGVHCYLAFN